MTEVPVVVTDEAGAHIARLGMQHHLEQMVDWVRQHIASLQGVRVTMSGRQLTPRVPPFVLIRAYQGALAENAPADLVEWEWAAWKAQTFPPGVCSSFTLIAAYQNFLSKSA